jgi:hypothetical protein
MDLVLGIVIGVLALYSVIATLLILYMAKGIAEARLEVEKVLEELDEESL